MTPDEFRSLERELTEHIQNVVAGYRYNGAEEYATLSTTAENARERVREIVEKFEFQETEKYG